MSAVGVLETNQLHKSLHESEMLPILLKSSSESRRCFESGSLMNNASTQPVFPLAVRSQAGWANMGQHLQHYIKNVQ